MLVNLYMLKIYLVPLNIYDLHRLSSYENTSAHIWLTHLAYLPSD